MNVLSFELLIVTLHAVGYFIVILQYTNADAIIWDGNWAFGCDFNNHDIQKEINIKREDCNNKCLSTTGCTHYTWGNFSGGTCFMKNGSVTKSKAVQNPDNTMMCGIKTENQTQKAGSEESSVQPEEKNIQDPKIENVETAEENKNVVELDQTEKAGSEVSSVQPEENNIQYPEIKNEETAEENKNLDELDVINTRNDLVNCSTSCRSLCSNAFVTNTSRCFDDSAYGGLKNIWNDLVNCSTSCRYLCSNDFVTNISTCNFYSSYGGSFFLLNIPIHQNQTFITSLHVIHDEFIIRFDVYLNQTSGSEKFNLSFYENKSTVYCDSFLHVSYCNGQLNVTFQNHALNNYSLKMDSWNSIKISQQYINSYYIYTIHVNGAVAFSGNNTVPRRYWYTIVYAYVNMLSYFDLMKNLYVVSKTEVLWSPWSDWSGCNFNGFSYRNRICRMNKFVNCSEKGFNMDRRTCISTTISTFENTQTTTVLQTSTVTLSSSFPNFYTLSTAYELTPITTMSIDLIHTPWLTPSKSSMSINDIVAITNLIDQNYDEIQSPWLTPSRSSMSINEVVALTNLIGQNYVLNQTATLFPYIQPATLVPNISLPSLNVVYDLPTPIPQIVSLNQSLNIIDAVQLATLVPHISLPSLNVVDPLTQPIISLPQLPLTESLEINDLIQPATPAPYINVMSVNAINVTLPLNLSVTLMPPNLKVVEWSVWSECSSTCGGGSRTRSPLNMLSNSVVENCILTFCPVDGNWGSWNNSDCSNTCGKGKIYFNRSCDNPRPSFNGLSCMGVHNYNEECPINLVCPVNGSWSMWSPWSLCNQPCEGGIQSRFRFCLEPKYGGKPCDGNSTETLDCPRKSCKKVNLNLSFLLVDEFYFPPSALIYKITKAISNHYQDFKRNVIFNVVSHSIRNANP